MMVAVGGCSTALGSIMYLQLQKYLVKKYGSYMTFGSIIIIDILTLLFLLPCIYFNIYGKVEGGHGQEDEDVKEEGYMDDKNVADVPLN